MAFKILCIKINMSNPIAMCFLRCPLGCVNSCACKSYAYVLRTFTWLILYYWLVFWINFWQVQYVVCSLACLVKFPTGKISIVLSFLLDIFTCHWILGDLLSLYMSMWLFLDSIIASFFHSITGSLTVICMKLSTGDSHESFGLITAMKGN